jgi:hypothetical protein
MYNIVEYRELINHCHDLRHAQLNKLSCLKWSLGFLAPCHNYLQAEEL